VILPHEYFAERLRKQGWPAVGIELEEPGVRLGDAEDLVVKLADGLVGARVFGAAVAEMVIHELEEASSEDVEHHDGRFIVGAWLDEGVCDVAVVAVEWQGDARRLEPYQGRTIQADGLKPESQTC
jgi:hypothetical protein